MKVIRYDEDGFDAAIQRMATSSSLFDRTIEERAREVIEAVSARGDAALLELTERFDGATLTADGLAVTQAEFLSAALIASPELREGVALARKNIETFSRRSLRRNWTGRNSQGARVGEKFDPFRRVGIYIPGGTAPLVSTALMTVVLAKVAGCPEIVVCSPCQRDGAINPALVYAARLAGATEVYRLGGAQAIAAMALGTETIRPVQKLFGPGNAYVVAAKRLLFGRVAVDLLPGPSEVLVLADATANSAFVVADLLAQAEHGSGHERVWLVTPSEPLIKTVQKEITRQLPKLGRRDYIERALEQNGCLILVRSLRDGVAVVNSIAPEHCEIMSRNPAKIGRGIVTAGALFIGGYSPTVLGDYVAGPSHELPTGGAGNSFAGLTVDQFQRRTSVVQYDRAALNKSLKAIRAFAEIEGLDAHGRSATIRIGANSPTTPRARGMNG